MSAAVLTGWGALGGMLGAMFYPASRGWVGLPPARAAVQLVAAALVALAFVFTALRMGWTVQFIAWSWFALIGGALAVADLTARRLPNAWVAPSYLIVLTLLGVDAVLRRDPAGLVRAAAGAAVMVTCYAALAVLSRGQLGAGDVKLAGIPALLLAARSWTSLLSGTLLCWLLAALVHLLLRATGRTGRNGSIPLGVFIVIGAFAALALDPPP